MLQQLLRVSALIAALAAPTLAGESCCTSCGCHQVRKICVPVCETIKETTWEYCCVCEDFCVPGPSKCVGKRCEPDCSGCPKCVAVMQPSCGGIFTRHILLKTPVVKEKCVTKWVVKTVCCGCNNACEGCTCTAGSPPTELNAPPAPPMPTPPAAPAAPAAPMPPAPPTPAKLTLR